MGKKKHAEEHENLERWLVSYADFITLLFATFVVLYALSQMDLAKFKELKVSLRKAFSSSNVIDSESSGSAKDFTLFESSGQSILDSGSLADNPITPILESIERQAEVDNFKEIKDELEKLGKDSGINVQVTDRGLVIGLNDSIFFASGSADVNKNVYDKLHKIGDLLKSKLPDHTIRVEGHTDNLPINSAFYPSNWELSAARASSVVRYFISNFKFDKNVFAAVGYADSKPMAPNTNDAGRRKNRRVEVVILRNRFLGSEPKVEGLNKLRLQKIKEYQEKNHIRVDEKDKTPEQNKPEQQEKAEDKNTEKNKGLSSAAQKLMESSGTNEVVTYKDAYDKESEKIAKQLKELEEKAKSEKPE